MVSLSGQSANIGYYGHHRLLPRRTFVLIHTFEMSKQEAIYESQYYLLVVERKEIDFSFCVSVNEM